MEVLKITNENFEREVLESNVPVIVDFYAQWCGPCKTMSPIIDSIAKENKDVKVGKINVEEEEKLAFKYDIISIPTIIIFKNGEEYKKIIGVTEKENLLNELK